MKTLTFAFDCELNSDMDYIKTGTKVKVVDTWKQYDGFAAVVITEGYSYNDEPIQFIPFVDHFKNESFVELRK
jgi:hypothetical protein